MTSETVDLQPVQTWLSQLGPLDRSHLLPTLIEAQRRYGHLTPPTLAAISQALHVPEAEIHGVVSFYTLLYDRPTGRTVLRVCTSPRCAQAGGEEVLRQLCAHLKVQPGEPTADGAYEIEEVPCLCLCDHAPAALHGDLSGRSPAHGPGGGVAGTAGRDRPGDHPRRAAAPDGALRIHRTGRRGSLHGAGGFAGLRRALTTLTPQQVIETIDASGLDGRGGAAFPTGRKWSLAASTPARQRFVVCNGDEFEPGTFKDRVLLEGDPLAVLEGMVLAGYAIGARRGYLYVRGEYPRAQRILGGAIDAARRAGFLGSRILGTDFDFEVELRSGAGAYICGEETALLESIEGKRGLPRLKPPYPVTHGLFGMPTAINNVETLAMAAWIVGQGVEAYRAVGTAKSPGTKLFCLSGDVEVAGTYEVPFGTTLGALLDLAGGVQGELQAVLLGGAAGAFAGPETLDLPLTHASFRSAGLPLGSGVIMVMNRERDLRRTCYHLARFFAHESCGKCFPCQLGTQRQVEIIARLADGGLRPGDGEALDDVAFTMTETSICGLGVTAASAIQSARRRWPELFQPAGG